MTVSPKIENVPPSMLTPSNLAGWAIERAKSSTAFHWVTPDLLVKLVGIVERHKNYVTRVVKAVYGESEPNQYGMINVDRDVFLNLTHGPAVNRVQGWMASVLHLLSHMPYGMALCAHQPTANQDATVMPIPDLYFISDGRGGVMYTSKNRTITNDGKVYVYSAALQHMPSQTSDNWQVTPVLIRAVLFPEFQQLELVE